MCYENTCVMKHTPGERNNIKKIIL